MQFETFVTLGAHAVAQLVAGVYPQGMGVAVPFNGTRRWYMATFDKSPEDLLSEDYQDQVFRQLRAVVAMMFADGVHTVYTPLLGHDLAERGEEYMRFITPGLLAVCESEAMNWYAAHAVHAACYGQLALVPEDIRRELETLPARTRSTEVRHYLRYGVFADRPTGDIITRVVRWYETAGTAPSAGDLIAEYYQGQVAPAELWIGSDQPTVFDVPLVMHGNTALYFLQFPTLYLDHRAWRRLLYDCLYVRGDQEALYTGETHYETLITGLGQREGGYWMPSAT